MLTFRWWNSDFLLLWSWNWISSSSWKLQQVSPQLSPWRHLCLLHQLLDIYILCSGNLLHLGIHGKPEGSGGWRCCPVWPCSCFPCLSWGCSCYHSFSILGIPLLHHAPQPWPGHSVFKRGVTDDRTGGQLARKAQAAQEEVHAGDDGLHVPAGASYDHSGKDKQHWVL